MQKRLILFPLDIIFKHSLFYFNYSKLNVIIINIFIKNDQQIKDFKPMYEIYKLIRIYLKYFK